jgi:uncharacterized protein (TIGR02246 family)
MKGQPMSSEVQALHERALRAWNEGDADAYAACFTPDGSIVGFDGSCVDGRDAIREHLHAIFRDHQVATYVGKVRQVREWGDVALLQAVAGMVPPGGNDINPATNAVQSLVAVRDDGDWRAVLFQNTPARFDGRPDAAAALTTELQQLLRER